MATSNAPMLTVEYNFISRKQPHMDFSDCQEQTDVMLNEDEDVHYPKKRQAKTAYSPTSLTNLQPNGEFIPLINR